jgi:hypothetical protein
MSSYERRPSFLNMAMCLMVLAVAPACGPEGDATRGEALDAIGEVASGVWTGWTSEENPPLECVSGRLVGGVDCAGRYCDNVSIDCLAVSATVGSSSWTSYFSEEGSNSRICSANEWMTGIACQGRYCDSISIKCTEILNKTPVSCSWTSQSYSEESGPFQAPAGSYIRGIRCDGSYCDNKFYYYCRLQ